MVSIGAMIRKIAQLRESDGISGFDVNFCWAMAETTGNGKDTTMLSDKQVDMIERIYLEHFA